VLGCQLINFCGLGGSSPFSWTSTFEEKEMLLGAAVMGFGTLILLFPLNV
jgi:hypothetical protein